MFRLAPFAVALVLLVAAVPASAGVVTGGSIAGADAASPCAAGPGLSCAAAQTQIGALTRAAAAPGVVTTWRALGSGASGIFIAQITGDGTLTRLRTSALATVSNVPTPQPTRLPIAAGQFVGLIAPNGSSIAYREGPVPGAESFAWLPAPAEGVTTPSSGSANPVVGAYEATIEPDADNDGFGDETQDKCLKETTAVPGGACEPAGFHRDAQGQDRAPGSEVDPRLHDLRGRHAQGHDRAQGQGPQGRQEMQGADAEEPQEAPLHPLHRQADPHAGRQGRRQQALARQAQGRHLPPDDRRHRRHGRHRRRP